LIFLPLDCETAYKKFLKNTKKKNHNYFLFISGKTFPKIKRRGPSTVENLFAMLSYNIVENNGNDEEMVEASSASSDYVFRIVTSMNSEFSDDQNQGIEFFINLLK